MSKRKRQLASQNPNKRRTERMRRTGIDEERLPKDMHVPENIVSNERDMYKAPTEGNLTFTRDQIPTVTGGASPAMDFTNALMTGNPEALRLAQEAGIDLTKVDVLEARTRRKKEESLADSLMAATYQWCKEFSFTAANEKRVMPILNHYRQSMRQAHRFELDNDFTQYATEVSNRTLPEKLLYRLQFATLPYETTWIEFNLRVKVRTMRMFHGHDDMPQGLGDRMGILLKRVDDTMATVEMVGEGVAAPDTTAPCLHGYIFSLNERPLTFQRKYNGLTPMSMQQRADFLSGHPYWSDLGTPEAREVINNVSRGALWGYGQGSGIIEGRDVKTLRIPKLLEQHGECAFSPFYDFFEESGRMNQRIMEKMSTAMTNEIAEFAGMMRWVVTVLAMLNEVPTRSEYRKPQHAVRAGLTRRLPAFDYHRITLQLPKTKPIPYLERHLANVERKHRAHMVREHWRTYLVEKPCGREEHAWEYDYENGYRLCGKCLSQSSLIHEHKRGDESLGWVHHEYSVKLRRPE